MVRKMQASQRMSLQDDDLIFTPPTSPPLAGTSSAITSDPSLILLNTPPRPSSSANAMRRNRRLRTSPSLVIVDEKSSQAGGKRRKSLRASPSLVIVDEKTPISSQPRAKRTRLDSSSNASASSTSQQLLPSNNSFPYSSQLPSSSLSNQLVPITPSPFPLATPPPTQASRLSGPTPTSSKGKRKRASTNGDEGQEKKKEEKRAARFKPKCPQNILDRVERVWQQRLFMIDRSRSGDELRETFSVLGSTGNVYTVVIDQTPRCNCPDALKGNHCKHILFIFLKVLRVPETSTHWYQKALLSSELEEIFSQAPLAPNCVAHKHVLSAHAQATAQFSGPSSQSTKKRWPTKDDDCPICYETMFGVAEGELKFCDACGNAIHEECWKQWQASNIRSGKSVTCVWCRAEVNAGGLGKGRKSQGNGAYSNEGYLNLASVAGLSPVRDTSTYHRWGRGYGRDFFDDDY